MGYEIGINTANYIACIGKTQRGYSAPACKKFQYSPLQMTRSSDMLYHELLILLKFLSETADE